MRPATMTILLSLARWDTGLPARTSLEVSYYAMFERCPESVERIRAFIRQPLDLEIPDYVPEEWTHEYR